MKKIDDRRRMRTTWVSSWSCKWKKENVFHLVDDKSSEKWNQTFRARQFSLLYIFYTHSHSLSSRNSILTLSRIFFTRSRTFSLKLKHFFLKFMSFFVFAKLYWLYRHKFSFLSWSSTWEVISIVATAEKIFKCWWNRY